MWDCEYTDTFVGEANYSWVHRAEVKNIEGASNRRMAREFKAVLGLTGMRGRSYWHGDAWEFRPYKSCTIAFAQFRD